jgi:hypothetical protein
MNHWVAFQPDGRLLLWGNNDYGKLNLPTGLP